MTTTIGLPGSIKSVGIRQSLAALGKSLPAIIAFQGFALSTSADPFPEVLPLPTGFQPEGIAVGEGNDFYVGSIPTGAIFKGDLRKGTGEILVPGGQGRQAVGLSFDHRTEILFVAGGPTGSGYAYDSETGELLQQWNFALPPLATFINDVVVTRDAAWFTDSLQPVLYRVGLGRGGRIPADSTLFETVPLGGDFQFVAGFNSNGIDATENGRALIIVNTALATLYFVNPRDGEATGIDLGGDSVPNGDGLLLDGNILYVVQNRLNQIAVIKLNRRLAAGEVIDVLTDPDLDVPTTIAKRRNALYAVNARFGVPDPANQDFQVVRVELDRRGHSDHSGDDEGDHGGHGGHDDDGGRDDHNDHGGHDDGDHDGPGD